jgi:hypothetical protein
VAVVDAVHLDGEDVVPTRRLDDRVVVGVEEGQILVHESHPSRKSGRQAAYADEHSSEFGRAEAANALVSA